MAAIASSEEELKAPTDLEYGHHNEISSAAHHILPLEIENGKGGLDKAEGGKVLEEEHEAAVAKQGVCARHKGKFLCLGITLAILAAIAIAVPLLWYTEPTAELLSQSALRINGLGSMQAELQLEVKNTNRYPVAFQNLNLDLYDGNGVHIGQVTRDQRQRVPARGTATTTAKANIQMSIAQLFAMGLDCIANDNLTKIKVRGTADGRFFGRTVKQVIGPLEQTTQCVTINIRGGQAGGGGATAGGGANGQQQPAAGGAGGIGNGQIIQQVGQVINEIFGGGGGGRPAGPAGPAGPTAAGGAGGPGGPGGAAAPPAAPFAGPMGPGMVGPPPPPPGQ